MSASDEKDDRYVICCCCHVTCLCLSIAGVLSILHAILLGFAIWQGTWFSIVVNVIALICYACVVVGICAKIYWLLIPEILFSITFLCKYVLEMVLGIILIFKIGCERVAIVEQFGRFDIELRAYKEFPPNSIPFWMLFFVCIKIAIELTKLIKSTQIMVSDLRELLARLAPLTAKLTNTYATSTASTSSSAISALIQEMRAVVSSITEKTLQSVTILPDASPSKNRLYAPVFYSHVSDSPNFETSLFGFRCAGNTIPLHNHPHMFGFLKAIRGRVLVSSFSWLNHSEEANLIQSASEQIKRTRWKPAKFEGSLILSSSGDPENSVAVLGPLNGNLHTVQAVDDGATFFDLLVPGYRNYPCTYYAEDFEKPLQTGTTYWMREIPEPSDFITQHLPRIDRNQNLTSNDKY
ncbi:hypothetical protein Ddc_09114 [Ditylenchus destructor]|nr:hypothetical protein Ddc_09114 [Ditylenchus destructor]